MDVFKAIKIRYTVRHYADVPLTQEQITNILDAARLAPTGSNEQLTKVIAVTNPAVKQALIPVCDGQKFVAEAGAVFVICASRDRTMMCGQSARMADCCIATSFMWLTAVEMGLQGCWIGRFHADTIAEVLGIPEELIPMAVLVIGTPAGDGPRREKKPMEELILPSQFHGVSK